MKQDTVCAYLSSSIMLEYIIDIYGQERRICVVFVHVNPVYCHLFRLHYNIE